MSGYESGWVSGTAYGMAYAHISDATIQKVVERGDPHFSKTFGFYVDAITDYYKRHRDRATDPIGMVMQCLADERRETARNSGTKASSWRNGFGNLEARFIHRVV